MKGAVDALCEEDASEATVRVLKAVVEIVHARGRAREASGMGTEGRGASAGEGDGRWFKWRWAR